MPPKLTILPLCKYCCIRTVARNNFGNLRKRCDEQECVDAAIAAKGHFRGKKRPDHGAKVSAALKGRPKSPEHIANMKVNTEHYRKQMLRNKGIDFTDVDYLEKWSTLVSDLRKSRIYKENCLQGAGIDASTMTDEEVNDSYRNWMSRKSSEAMQANPSMGNGIRSVLTDLRFRQSDTTCCVRSHAERRFVTDFLERLEIPWDYEMVRLDLPGGMFYLPDFTIDWCGAPAIVEIKGTVYEDLIPKIIAGSEAALAAGYRYFFIQKLYFKQWRLEDLNNFEFTQPLTVGDLQHIYSRNAA